MPAPVSKLRVWISGYEENKTNKQLLANALAQISLLKYDIEKADSIIFILRAEIFQQQKISESYKDEMATKDNAFELLKMQVKSANKSLRRQKRKTFAAVVGGILATGATFYFSNK